MRAVGIAFGAVVLLATACGPPTPDEERIRQQIEAMKRAVDEGNTRAFVQPLAEDFGARGRDLDRRGVRLLINRELRAHEKLSARVFDIEVELQGADRARATFHAVTTGGSGLIPDTGGWYRVESGWRRSGDEWLLISADWERVAGRRGARRGSG